LNVTLGVERFGSVGAAGITAKAQSSSGKKCEEEGGISKRQDPHRGDWNARGRKNAKGTPNPTGLLFGASRWNEDKGRVGRSKWGTERKILCSARGRKRKRNQCG